MASDLLDYVCKHYDKAGFFIDAKLSFSSEPNSPSNWLNIATN